MTASAPLRVGIIGAGIISAAHARSLQTIDGARLVGFADLDQERTEAQARRFGVRAFRDTARLLDEVDAVTICTPRATHAAVAIEALTAGKHVLTEKPMAQSLVECDQMLAAAARTDAQLSVVYQNRFNRYANRLRWLKETGRVGRRLFASAMSWSTHAWDQLRYVAGDPVEIMAHWQPPQRVGRDTLVAHVTFADGNTGLMQTAPVFEPVARRPYRITWVHLAGERLVAAYVLFSWELLLASGDSEYLTQVERELAQQCTGPAYGEGHAPEAPQNVPAIIETWQESHRPLVQAWVEALCDGRPAPVSAIEGRKTIEFMVGAFKSAVEDRPVRLPLAADDPWYADTTRHIPD